ncbi:MAG: PAS domain S-box protein [Sphingobacteriaceae bacterium]|nr:MAG: PAS domain S-box protein [Sphingobacteriaceae bacterium]
MSDPVITLFFGHLDPVHINFFRSLNDFAFVVAIAIILYIEIGNQQKKLAQSEEQYRELFESNPNPMWIYDINTFEFIKINNAAVEKYGYSRAEFLSMTILDIRPVRDHDKVKKFISGIKDGVKKSGIWEHLKSNGESIMVSITSHAMLFENRKCSVVIATDVTELLEKERKLQEANQKIKSSNEVLLNVAWSNSHELRKPLCSMLSLVDLLNETTDEQERKEYIRLLQQCTKEMDEITQKNNNELNAISV